MEAKEYKIQAAEQIESAKRFLQEWRELANKKKLDMPIDLENKREDRIMAAVAILKKKNAYEESDIVVGLMNLADSMEDGPERQFIKNVEDAVYIAGDLLENM